VSSSDSSKAIYLSPFKPLDLTVLSVGIPHFYETLGGSFTNFEGRTQSIFSSDLTVSTAVSFTSLLFATRKEMFTSLIENSTYDYSSVFPVALTSSV
jgi:hypothetical protein